MSATNDSALPKNVGFLYVAQYTTSVTQLLQDLSNASAVKGQLDTLSYQRLSSITDLKEVENMNENLVKIDTDDNGTIYKATTPKISVTGNRFEMFEPDIIKTLLGQNVLSQAGTLVSGHTQTWAANTITKSQFYAFDGQNSNGTKPTITYIKQGATTLVEWTDYEVVKNGVRGVVFLTPFVVTNSTTATYDYTPAAAKYQGTVIQPSTIPQLVIKIVSTDSATGKVKTTYLVNCGIESDLISAYIDVVRSGDMTPTPFEFVGNKLGYVLKYSEV